MPKKKEKEIVAAEPLIAKKAKPIVPLQLSHAWLPSWSMRQFYIFFIALTFLFYGNTILHEYALDDGLVIGENAYTLRGIKGVPDILSHDSFQAFYEANGASKNELTGGRWRPLSIITFAIEYSFFGKNPYISHFLNVALYALLICCVFYFMVKYIFKENHWLAFIIAFLFLIHPLHTESVANIKSRDELMSLLFIILFFVKSFSYLDTQNNKDRIWSLVYLGLAFLSKENAITLLAIFPLTLYVFRNASWKEAFQKSIPLIATSVIYLVVRYAIVGKGSETPVTELLNNPYAIATTEQKWSSILTLPLYYFRLLFFPYSLSYDYSYSQLPYESFTSIKFLASLLVNISLLIFGVLNALKKKTIGYAILFFYISYSIVSNVFIPLGATMGERLMFQPSLGFCIAIALILYFIFTKFSFSKNSTYAVLAVILILAGMRTITRNNDWKNNNTLFLQDVKTAPNSVKTNNAAATALISLFDASKDEKQKKEYMQQTLQYLDAAEKIYPTFEDIYLNRGSSLWRMEKYEEAEKEWNRARELNPLHGKFREYDNILKQRYLAFGIEKGNAQQYAEAIPYLQKACVYGARDPEAWYNLGGVAFMAGDFAIAKEAISKCLDLNPNHPLARQAWEGLKDK